MADVRLKFDGGEFVPKNGVTTLGRTTDNDVSFPSDSNVSRYHAEIEFRDGEFCLIDLSSSNGTTVNGTRVNSEVYLRPGDHIVLGGSSELSFDEVREESASAVEADDPAGYGSPVGLPPIDAAIRQAPSLAAAAATPAASAGSRTMLMIAGGAVLIAVVVLGVAGAIYYTKSGPPCTATVKITSPETKDTISSPTDIEVETSGGECVKRAVFTLDGREFARSDEEPFTATLDPAQHPDEADAELHSVAVTLVDEQGKPVAEPATIELQLETRKAAKEKEPEIDRPEEPRETKPTGPSGKELSLVDVGNLTVDLTKRFNGGYSAPNKEFLIDVQKKTGEFARPGFYQRAVPYKDVTNLAFVRDNGLPPALGFILAMSRSNFDPRKQGSDEGIWRMNPSAVSEQKYGGECAEPLSDAKQICASKAAGAYLNKLHLTACGEDFMCTAAAFGKSVQDAATWRGSLPNGGRDLWNTLKQGPEREQLVRFIAAGIVAENPQRFGLAQDRPISTLFP